MYGWACPTLALKEQPDQESKHNDAHANVVGELVYVLFHHTLGLQLRQGELSGDLGRRRVLRGFGLPRFGEDLHLAAVEPHQLTSSAQVQAQRLLLVNGDELAERAR